MSNLRKGICKRAISMLLTIVMVLGMLPMTVIPAMAAGNSDFLDPPADDYTHANKNFPDTVSVTYIDGNTKKYSLANGDLLAEKLGSAAYAQALIHLFHVKVGSETTIGFCGDHTASMKSTALNKIWSWDSSKTVTIQPKTKSYEVFLDYFYYNYEKYQELYQQYNGNESAMKAADPWVWGKNEVMQNNAWVQACIWLFNADTSRWNYFLDLSDMGQGEEERKLIAKEMRSAYAQVGGAWSFDDTLSFLKDIIEAWEKGSYDYRAYTKYYPEGSHSKDQPFYVPEPKTTATPVYVKIMKVDEKNEPLAGAEFTIYEDSSCTNPIDVQKTGADGWAYFQIDGSVPKGGQKTLYAKETAAPADYEKISGTWSVVARDPDNAQKETAAAFNGGSPVKNYPGGDDPETVIKKVDALTGQGIGPAIFHIEGEPDDESLPHVSRDVPTDAQGNVDIQWKNAGADNYIPAGHYMVTEKQAPPGYEKDPASQYLTLVYDGASQTYTSSGPLYFKNAKLRSIIIQKLSTDGTPLAGATFEIRLNGQPIDTATTDANGMFTYAGKDGTGLKGGYYEFEEITPPPGYLLPVRNVQGVWLDPWDVNANDPITLTFSDSVEPEIVIKKAENGTDKPLAGAVFEMLINGENYGTVGPTGLDGRIVIDYETYGKFLQTHGMAALDEWTLQVRETRAPDGYLIDDDNWQTAVLHQGETLKEFVFTDTLYPEIRIYKRDTETGELLDNCSFRVTVDGAEMSGPFVSGANGNPKGTVIINHEKFQEFLKGKDWDGWQVTVTEVEMPEGYNKDFQADSGDYTITKTLQYGQSVVEFEFKDTSFRKIRVTKRDASNTWTLAGAEFTLDSITLDPPKNGTTIHREGKTDGNGQIVFDELPNGVYKLTEITPPTGYELPNPNTMEVTVTSDSDNVIDVEFQDYAKEGLLLRKVDGVTNRPVPGVEFSIRYLGAADTTAGTTNDARTYITDESGHIYLPDCATGWYEIRETAVPDGYNIDPEPRLVQIVNTHQDVTVTFTNYQDAQLIVLKKDSQTSLPLPGALFTITTAGGNYIATIETGPNGYAQLSGLEPGGYVITEVEAPDGHLIDTTPKTFEIKVGQTEPVFIIFYNDNKINLFIRKEDAQTHIGLEGAVYRVTLSDGSVVKERLVTGEDGLASLTGLEPGTYEVTEIEAPAGYLLNSETQRIYLAPGATETMLFRNDKPGGIAILKTDGISGVPVKDAEFTLYSMDDKPLGTYKTGADGYIRIPDLEPGYYFVQETRAPEGYLLDNTKHKVLVENFRVTLVELKNYEQSGLTIHKIAAESQLPLAGAEFGVYDMHGSLIQTIKTDSSGVASLNGLQPAWYRVKETRAPLGYVLNEQEYQVEIVEGRPASLTVENTEESGITVHKVDAANKNPLVGAEFELRTTDNTLVGTYSTNASGSFVTKKVDPGVYFLFETKAPDGYSASEEPTQVIVKEGENPVVTVENHKNTTIQLMKVDAVTGTYLEGAEFEVWTLNCQKLLGTYVTDKSGIAFSDPLPAGNYVVIESKAPLGYVLDETHHHVQVLYDHPAILKVADQPLTSIMITKVSTVDDTPLLGAKFEVKTAEGDVVGEYTTDTTGTAVTPVLEPGVYYVQEVEPPDGYLLNKKIFKVEVKAGTMATLVVEDAPECSLVIFKGSSGDKKGIAGAVFKVETADGDFIGTYTTDAQGEALVRPITPDHYIVTEMSAPEGFMVSETPKTITVKVGVINRVEFMDAAKGSLVIRLEDIADGRKLENGRFQLYWAATGKLIDEGVTDGSGSIVWGDLTPGRYIIVQTFAPDGYTIVDERKEGIVVSGDTTLVVFQDSTAGLVIEKLDKLTSEPLMGARFQVTRNTDNIVIGEFETDVDGLALVGGLTPGMYTVEELVAPKNYEIDEESQLVHVKASEQAHVTFRDTPYAGITIKTVDAGTQKPIPGIIIEVWTQNGELVNTFTSDSTGVIETGKLPSGHYVIKVINAGEAYVAVTSEQTVELKQGVSVTVSLEFMAKGTLQIFALSKEEVGLPGMKVTITKINGERVGEYSSDSSGLISVPGLDAGWYVVTEVSGPDGYTISGETSQNIEIKSNGTATVKFYHEKTYGVQIQTVVKQTGAMVAGVKYQITTLDGTIVGTYTSDAAGLVYANLEPGWYSIKMMELPEGYKNFTLCASRNVEVKAGLPTVVQFELTQLSSMRVKFVDGSTEQPIYGVRVILKDGTGTIVNEFTSNNEGYITISESLVNGSYTLEQISVPSGYTVDPVPKSLDVLNGETTEIVWRMYKGAGQIQVHLTSNAYNSTVDLAAGSNLQGAVFEIYDPFTYVVLCTMTTDSYGVAASSGLPIGRYIIREKSPAPYYGLSGKETEVYIKINNDVVRVEYQAGPLTLNTSHTIKANTSVSAGTSMKAIFTAVNNDSSDRLDSFYWTIKVPTDAMRAGTLYTGKWSHPIFYSINYKTNMNDYRPLASGLNSSNAYQYDLSSLAINVQGGEYVTDIRFEFGTVPAGFKPTVSPIFYGYVMPNVPQGYKVIIRSECGGKYGESWNTASALWTTNVVSKGKSSGSAGINGLPTNLPKTGY